MLYFDVYNIKKMDKRKILMSNSKSSKGFRILFTLIDIS